MRHARAFTIIELLLALVLASMVLASMVGVLRVMATADTVSAERVDSETDLAIAQNLMRRVFVSLAAAQPIDPAAARKAIQARAAQDSAEEGADDTADQSAALTPTAPPDIAPMFDLYFQEFGRNEAAPILDCVVIDPPGALSPNADRVTLEDLRTTRRGSTREWTLMSRRIVQVVRGRFEVVPMASEGEPRYALEWRGIEPATQPVVLIPGITGLEWWILPIDEKQRDWRQTISAKLASEFPIAIRLHVWTDTNQELDWMFETEMQPLGAEMLEPVPPFDPSPDTGNDAADGTDDR